MGKVTGFIPKGTKKPGKQGQKPDEEKKEEKRE